MKLLLVSNSGRPYLEHCREDIVDFLSPAKRALFIGAAAFFPLKDYVAKVRAALEPVGLTIDAMELDKNPKEQLAQAEAVLVGGGNTYKLLRDLKNANLIGPLQERVKNGLPFIGWSAGSNIAGPTILSTNDWNVVGLSEFSALSLVPFNINPHYLEADPMTATFAETRDDRIAEYHCVNSNTVLGIEEQTSVLVEDDSYKVLGKGRVRRFEKGQTPIDFKPGDGIQL